MEGKGPWVRSSIYFAYWKTKTFTRLLSETAIRKLGFH